jgi:hypothetical protein
VDPIFTWPGLAQRTPCASASISCRIACVPLFFKVPSVITGRRFRALHRKPAHVAFYHVENTGVYATRAWIVVNATPWILRLRKIPPQANQTAVYGQAR